MIMESYGTIILFLSVTLLVQGSTADQPNIVLLFADDVSLLKAINTTQAFFA